METSTSLPEQGTLLSNVAKNELTSVKLIKSSSILFENNKNNEEEGIDSNDDEDVPIRPFGNLKNSIENIENINDDNKNNDNSVKNEDNYKIELEYEKVLKSFLPFHLQSYLENLDEEEADILKTINVETFCVVAAINISGKNKKNNK